MNPSALTKLKPYMFGVGNVDNSVKSLKTFLKFHPRIPANNLKINNLFDKETRKAVAYIQKHKGLKPTGRMDADTWTALGTEMNPIQIKSFFAGDATIQNLLGLGYLLKNPHPNIAPKNSLEDSVIRTHSEGQVTMTAGYNFTFRVFVTVFAPFDWFGPLSLSMGGKGDRRFGDNPNASYRLQCFSTVTAAPGDGTYNWNVERKKAVTIVSGATTSLLLVPLPPIPIGGTIIPGTVYPKTAKSPGHLISEENPADYDFPESNKITNSPARLKYHFFGNDRAFRLFGESSMLASDIDLHPNIRFDYKPDKDNPKNVSMHVTGNITGDQFPAVETYIIDKNENGVMLGVWQICEGDGPVFTRDGRFGIEGDKKLPMINIDITVIVEDGIFKGVVKNGRIVSLEEHNQYYKNLPTITKDCPPMYQKSSVQPIPAPLPTPTPLPKK